MSEEGADTKCIHPPPQILAVLLSATCIGNDGRSCPLFHGSLAPMIFGKTSDDKMRRLLLKSNNITWTQTLFWCDLVDFPTLQREIFQVLSKTRYSSRSLKRLQVTVDCKEDKRNVLSFLQTGCEMLETLEIGALESNFSLNELASCRALANSLICLRCSDLKIPNFSEIQHFNRLQALRLYNTQINDEQLHPLASLKNLRRLEIIRVTSCSGSFLDVVCPSLTRLQILDIRICEDFRHVSGLKHLANSLEELSLNSLHDLRNLRGHGEWVEFPFLKKLNLVFVSFGYQIQTFALSPDAFPSLDILELKIKFSNDTFYAKILESCQRESSAPIKRITIHNRLEKEGLEALLMVPVEDFNLDYTQSNHVSSDIPWSEEKIITKTLKKFKWDDLCHVSSIAFLMNCKQLESLALPQISSKIDLSALSNLPLLKELTFKTPLYQTEKFLIKDVFRTAGENIVVLPSIQKFVLRFEIAVSCFEGLENIFPNLRILESWARVDQRENDENLLNSFLYVVRNFPKLEEIRFNSHTDLSADEMFIPMNTRIPRLLKKENPNLNIYYPSLCQYEPEPEKEATRRDRE